MIKKSGRDKWPALAKSSQAHTLVNFLKCAELDSLTVDITLRPHSLECSGLQGLADTPNVPVVLKATLFPVPGKSKLLRSMADISTNGSGSYSFASQSVVLSMTSSESRGRVYALGYSPFIHIEVSFNNRQLVGRGSFYLPGALSLAEDDIVTLPIKFFDGSGREIAGARTSLVFEIAYTSAAGPPSPSPSPSKKCLPSRLNPQQVQLRLLGITGKDVIGGNVEVSLPSQSGIVTRSFLVTKSFEKSSNFDIALEIVSLWPEGDVLVARIFDDMGILLGEACVPVLAAKNGALSEPMAHRLWTVTEKEVMATESLFLIMTMGIKESEVKDTNSLVRRAATRDTVPQSEDHSSGAVDGSVQPSKKSTAERVWEPVNSLGGTLLGCLQGFVFNTSAPADSLVLDGQVRYSAEIALYPTDGSQKMWKTATTLAAPMSSAGGLINVPWTKGFDLEIAWALKQRFCLHLNVKMYEESSRSGGRKRLIGEAFFDIVSLVTMKESEFTTFLLPVFSPKTSKKLARYRTEIGKCVFGMRFFDNGAGAGREPAPLPPLKASASSTLFLKTMSTNGSKTFTSTIDTAASKTKKESVDYRRHWLAALTGICSKFWSSVLSNNMQEQMLNFCISLGPIRDASQTAKAFQATDKVLLNVDSMAESFETALLYNDYTNSFTAHENVLVRINSCGLESGLALCFCIGTPDNCFCECWVVLSKRSLTTGRPIELDLPMRDADGLRVAIIQASSHVSGSHMSRINISDSVRVIFLDGTVNDSSWPFPIDLFFECSLLPPSDYKGDPSISVIGRTNWVSGESSGSTDALVKGLQCLLDIPTNAVPEAYKLGEIPNNAPKWSISFVGRDASRPGSPAVASGVLSIPWLFFTRAKSCVEKVVLKLESNRSSPLTVKLELIENNQLPEFGGIGSVLFWIREARFPQGNVGIDSAEVAVRWSRSNALSNQVFENDNFPASHDAAVFACVSTPKQQRDETVARNKALNLSVPVPGGYCDLRLRISTDAHSSSYCTLIPALATVTRLDSISLFDFPSFNIPLAEDQKRSSKANASITVPRLDYNAIFVPYVVGRLIVHVSDIKFNQSHPILKAPGAKTLAMRFSVGTGVNKFSNQFTLKEVFNKNDTSNNLASGSFFSTSKKMNSLNFDSTLNSPGRFSGTAASLLSSQEVIELPVDTFELMNLPGADGNVEMLDLRCCIIDVDSMKTDKMTIVDGILTRPKYVKGVGVLPTAGLYYMAAREAVRQPSDYAGGGTPVGATPETPVTIPIYGANDSEMLGEVCCTIRFVMAGASPSVLSALQSQIASASRSDSDPDAAVIELGLKQAFRLADSDDTGNISKDELTQVLTTARSTSDLTPRDDRVGMIKGLDNAALSVLLDAMTALTDEDVYDNFIMPVSDMTDVEFKSRLDELFQRMDVDGDGSISWWEWNQMLQAALLIKKSAKTPYIDLFDPLMVAYLASNYCIESLQPESFAAPPLSSSASGLLRSARMIAWGGDASTTDLDSMVTKLPPEARGKLMDSITALRKSTGTEQRGWFNDSIEDEETKTKLRVARGEAEAARRLLLAERERYAKLESEVVKLKDYSPTKALYKEDISIESERSKRFLEEQVATNTEHVATAHWKRIQKKKATKTISIFLKKYIKDFLKRMLERAEGNRKGQRTRSVAAVDIQRVFRGFLGRQRVDKMWASILILQRFVRKRKLIRLARLSRSAMINEINKAATRLQATVRMAQARKKVELLRLDAERKAREEAERKAREEAERRAKEEAERKAREEAERKAREEAERRAKEEAERKAREEAERKAREEAKRRVKEEAERKAREEAERRAKEEAERRALEEKTRLSREEELRLAALRLEEARKNEAAVKIQSFFRGRRAWGWLLRTLLQREVDIVEVVEANAPTLLESIGYWVRIPTPIEIQQRPYGARTETISIVQGFVNDVDEVRQIVKVVFEKDLSMAEREVAFNSRGLEWFKEVNELVEQDNVLKKMKIVTKADSWVVEIEKPTLLSCVGFLVRFPDLQAQLVNFGRVFDVDEGRKTFKALLESGPDEVKEFDYYSPPADLIWLKEIDDYEAQRIFERNGKINAANSGRVETSPLHEKSDGSPVFDFKDAISRPAFEAIAKNKYYVRIAEGSSCEPPIDGLVVDTVVRGSKKYLAIRLIADGSLTEETHEVQYAYKDSNVMTWYSS